MTYHRDQFLVILREGITQLGILRAYFHAYYLKALLFTTPISAFHQFFREHEDKEWLEGVQSWRKQITRFVSPLPSSSLSPFLLLPLPSPLPSSLPPSVFFSYPLLSSPLSSISALSSSLFILSSSRSPTHSSARDDITKRILPAGWDERSLRFTNKNFGSFLSRVECAGWTTSNIPLPEKDMRSSWRME